MNSPALWGNIYAFISSSIPKYYLYVITSSMDMSPNQLSFFLFSVSFVYTAFALPCVSTQSHFLHPPIAVLLPSSLFPPRRFRLTAGRPVSARTCRPAAVGDPVCGPPSVAISRRLLPVLTHCGPRLSRGWLQAYGFAKWALCFCALRSTWLVNLQYSAIIRA